MRLSQKALLLALLTPCTAGAFGTGFAGTTRSFFKAPVCRALDCAYEQVQRSTLEGSGNPVRIYQYRVRAGSRVEVTRFNFPGQQGHDLIVNVRYLNRSLPSSPSLQADAAQLASAASGFTVRASQVAACFKALQKNGAPYHLIVSGGFEDPGVSCDRHGSGWGVSVQLTN